MDFKQTPLYQNKFLDEFDNTSLWSKPTSDTEKCNSCQKMMKGNVCSSQLGLECISCVVENIKNCVNAENIESIPLASIRRVMSFPNSLRWRFLFLFRFDEIYQQESTENHFGLETLLIGQLGYVTSHPLSTEIRQIAYDVCLRLGDKISPLLNKLYRQNPWQFNINVITLIGRINPAVTKAQYMLERAIEHSKIEVRFRAVDVLKNIDSTHFPWAQNLLNRLCLDPDQNIRAIALKYSNFRSSPIYKKEPNKQVSLIDESERNSKTLLDLYENFRKKRTDYHLKTEEIISELYTLTNFRKVFTSIIIPLFERLNLIDKFQKPLYKLKKQNFTTIFTYFILDKDLIKAMYESYSDEMKKIFESLVWEGGSYKISEIEKTLNTKIITKPRGGFYYGKDFVRDNFLIFQVHIDYHYYSGDPQGFIFFDDEIRKIFKKHLPLPKSTILRSVEKIPNKLYTYCDENQFVEQVEIFKEYLRQGNIQLSKSTGKILKTSIKKWNNYFNIHEFYSEDDNNLTYLYSHLVIEFLFNVSPKNITVNTLKEIKKLIIDYFKSQNLKQYNFLSLLTHIRSDFYYNSSFEKDIRKSFLIMLKKISEFNWVSIENLLAHIKCSSEAFQLSYRQHFEHSLYLNIPSSGYYSYGRDWITKETYIDVLLIPLVKSMFFLFSALGLVNIAYELPSNKKYQLRDRKFLTVFDGLKYVQLSDFGKYIIGISDSYDFKMEEKSTKVVLDEKRLIVTIDGPGKLERMVLHRLAEQIGDNYFKLSFRSLLNDCSSENDIKNKISIFKEKISSKLPLVWEEFFKEVEEKINPLEYKENLFVFKIKPSKELIAFIARDNMLKKYILKVEDYHIAIKGNNLGKVKKRLREFGFFIDNI